MNTPSELSSVVAEQHIWHERATVRTRPRHVLTYDDIHKNKGFFPKSRQPLVIHPFITDLGDSAINHILAQTAYRYMYEIATLETEVVNQITLKIAKNIYPFEFSDRAQQDALSIIVDESYHAYVAFDFINQVKTITGIHPIKLPQDNAVSRSLSKFKNRLNAYDFSIIEIVAISLSENVLTKDLVFLKEETETHPFFIQTMQDHLMDEGRHASYFIQVLTYVWNNIPPETHSIIANFIPEFIDDYIDSKPNIAFDKEILRSLYLEETMIDEIIGDTYFMNNKNDNAAVKSFLNVLKRTKILDDKKVKQALIDKNFNYE